MQSCVSAWVHPQVLRVGAALVVFFGSITLLLVLMAVPLF